MKFHHVRVLSLRLFHILCVVLALPIFLTEGWGAAHAQVPPPITSSGLNTTISGPIAVGGSTQYNITGGTRPGGGTNLFHGFGDFNVPTNNIANFLNETALPTNNILGRVTGGNISNIFGAIQTEGFGSANLFLMNPAGFLFGPTATVNVGGMVAFTSADSLRLTDGVRFNAVPDAAADALLSAAPVAAFGFLGSNPAAITVQGSQFAVAEGTGISLVGGNITVQSGVLEDGTTVQSARLSAPGGQINVASVASPGEVSALDYLPAPGITLGNINLSQGVLLDVSADAAGTIRIRGGQLVINDATLSADTVNADGAARAIDINITGDLSITDTRGIPAITARTTGNGNAGEVQIVSGNLTATTTFLDPNFLPTTLLDTHTSGEGRGGDISIVTGNLTAAGTFEGGNLFTFIDSGTTANGRGVDATITARTFDLINATISTGQLTASAFVEDLSTVNGSAGHLTITADTLRTQDGAIDTSALFGTSPLQQGGDMTITAHDISMVNTQVSSINANGGGALTIKADSIVMDFTSFEIDNISGPGGGISVEARVVELTNGSAMVSSTLGSGNAGDIRLTATDHVSIIGDLGTNELAPFQPSGLFSNSFGNIFGTLGGPGNAGNIIVTTPRLEMNAGRINTATSSSGQGGNVTLNVTDTISISGEFPSDSLIIPSIFDIGPRAPSGVVTSTVGSEFCGAVCGNAGTISINTGSLLMGPGSRIDSGSGSTGLGGDITISAADTISLAGTLTDGTPVGVFSRSIGTDPSSGSGGNIALTAGQSVTISDGAAVSASTRGTGNAGSVTVEGLASPAQSVLIDGAGSGIFTETQGTGAGGNIFVSANTVTLQNGGTLSAATSGTEASATGGSITVNAYQLNTDGATITVETTGAGNAGQIALITQPADGLSADAISLSNSLITSSTSSNATAGDILLKTGTLHVENTQISSDALPSEGFTGGNAGTLLAQVGGALTLTNAFLSTSTAGNGNAGNILLEANRLRSENSAILSASVAPVIADLSGGNGGTIDLTVAQDILLINSTIDSQTNTNGNAGNIVVTATDLTLETSSLSTGAIVYGGTPFTGGHAGNIEVTVGNLSMHDGLIVSQSQFSAGNGGLVAITASESITTSGSGIFPFAVSTSTDGAPPFCPGTCGNGGNITITAPTIALNGVGLNSTTTGQGTAGNILVQADHLAIQNGAQISASAEGPVVTGAGGTVTIQGLASPAQSVLIDGAGSGLFTDTQGAGAGGNIFVNANSVTLQNGGTLSAKTSGTVPEATGGTITLIAPGQVAMTGGSSITASSTGPANAGDIFINAGQQLTLENSSITTEASQASGGNITIQAANLVQLGTSMISASVQGGLETSGGNITIDPNAVILQNSQIIANAVQGNGGTISVTTNFLIVDGNLIGPTTPLPPNVISASSQFGQQGTVTIQSPLAPAGGKIVPLSQKPLLPTSLLSQRCAALASGEFSSFTVAGRDSLPAEPGGWLSSPLALATLHDSAAQEARGEGLAPSPSHLPRWGTGDGEGEAPLLSLRQIAPTGFLTQAFAVDQSGCAS